MDLFDDMIESDGHLRSLVEGRITAVSGKEWIIQPGGTDSASIEAAKALEESLTDELDFACMLEHQLTAPYYGFAASEIIWEAKDKLIVPSAFIDVPHRRFKLGTYGELRLVTRESQMAGEELIPGKWVVTKRRGNNIARAGLMRTATWWAMFKRMATTDFVVAAEKYGNPYVLGLYDDNVSEETRSALEQVVRNLGDAGHAILHKDVEVVLHDAGIKGSGNSIHPSLISLCEAQMSKLISGATLGVDTGQANTGSWALGKVHANKAFSLELSDAGRFSNTFRNHVSAPFVKFNGFGDARPPRLKIRVVQELDPESRVRVASVLVNELGMSIDGKQILDELGFKPPSKDEDAMRPMKSAPVGEVVSDD